MSIVSIEGINFSFSISWFFGVLISIDRLLESLQLNKLKIKNIGRIILILFSSRTIFVKYFHVKFKLTIYFFKIIITRAPTFIFRTVVMLVKWYLSIILVNFNIYIFYIYLNPIVLIIYFSFWGNKLIIILSLVLILVYEIVG